MVGGGVVGAAAALALGRAGLRTALLEQSQPPPFDPQGETDLRVFAVNRASQRLFERLDVWPEMLVRGVSPYEAMEVWDARSPGRIRFEAADVGEPDLGHIIENRVIQSTLWDALDEAGVECLCPATLAHLEILPDAAHADLEDGRRVTASLVVGADGARSRVRTLVGIGVNSTRYGQRAVVANVTTERHNEATAWQRFLPTGPLAFLPLADGRSSIVWSTDTEDAERLVGLGEDAFRAELAAAFEYRLGAVTATGPRASFPLAGSQALQYVRSRVALVGDAAHTVHPLAGQGANLGFADVTALVRAIGERPGDPGALRGLRAYERVRRGENWVMMRAMEGFSALFGSRLSPVEMARGLGLNLVDRLPPVKHGFLRRALGDLKG
ncbi:2-octaprenyl-3-methyl-6-methoxy-1,4-benzoquinol hydroxylase [Thioalkalivibrio denitrificans]|uniref:2-octaprenyl-3-methyl-6-methoxy-1,4-benzoquinol hydroxylase n=1 Tax=Thioalkalivibrio denitrificans TaxID=108003 RepID=A0A1V3NIR2_9GAMM|nr:2-octaprenyl-3-methyl-6-methoxy-1,4-benzoquinol hydroxylase [Thioalkalivibrio denitrificans]